MINRPSPFLSYQSLIYEMLNLKSMLTKEEFINDVTEISDMPDFNKELVTAKLKKWLASIGMEENTRIFITRENSLIAGHYLEIKEGDLVLNDTDLLINFDDETIKEVYFEIRDKVNLGLNKGG